MIRVVFTFIILTLSFDYASAQRQPNIIFYMTDDHSQQNLSVYGADDLKTPNIDRLAAMGKTFDRAFIASPSCAPSRAALLTGLMPARNGAEPNHTYPNPDIPLLTEKLQENGYEVIAFGKVAHGEMNERSKFDYYEDVPKRGDLSGSIEKYLEDNPSDKPRCILVGDKRPHILWTEEMAYNPGNVELPEYFIDTKETREHMSRYYTDISGIDKELGDVMDLVDQRFGDDFIFLFSSDHGAQWPFAKWNLYEAGIRVPLIVVWPDHIQEGSRTDAMVSWIDIFPTLLDLTSSSPPEGLDGRSFAPVLNGEKNTHHEFIFSTHTGDGNYNVYPIRSVRTERFKYILNLLPNHYHTNHSDLLRNDGRAGYWDSWDRVAKNDPEAAAVIKKYFVRPKEEFFDLKEDPNEQQNIIGEEQYQDELDKLRKKLNEWMQAQGDPKLIHAEPYPILGPKDIQDQFQEEFLN